MVAERTCKLYTDNTRGRDSKNPSLNLISLSTSLLLNIYPSSLHGIVHAFILPIFSLPSVKRHKLFPGSKASLCNLLLAASNKWGTKVHAILQFGNSFVKLFEGY